MKNLRTQGFVAFHCFSPPYLGAPAFEFAPGRYFFSSFLGHPHGSFTKNLGIHPGNAVAVAVLLSLVFVIVAAVNIVYNFRYNK